MKKVRSKKYFHPSFCIVFWCLGIVVGMILATFLKINYFASPIWLIVILLLMIYAYLHPTWIFLIIAFGAGVILAWWRVANFDGKSLESTAIIVAIRDWFSARITSVISEPEVNLGLSYLMGMKSNLPADLDTALKTVGLAHIVVASGTHLSILVELSKKFFGKISRFSGAFFSIFLIIFFMSMVGWTPSILRAGMMAILTILAWYVGRKFEPWRIILEVATMTLLINPTFITNLGWILSFASYAGIMILAPKIQQFLYGAEKPNFMAATIITTVAATLMTLPITLYYFGSISLISVVANLLILPTLPYVMGLTFLTGVVAEVPFLGSWCGFLATKMLDFHIFIIKFFGELDYFVVGVEKNNLMVFLLYIIILAPFIIGHFREKMIKLRKIDLEKICLDTVNGPPQNAKKP